MPKHIKLFNHVQLKVKDLLFSKKFYDDKTTRIEFPDFRSKCASKPIVAGF